MKLLFIGDMHVTLAELEDSARVIDLVCEIVGSNEDVIPVFLGDQYHTHAILRLEVIDFWRKAFKLVLECSRTKTVFALAGNHDMTGDSSSKATAMDIHATSGVIAVTKLSPASWGRKVTFLPYMSNEEFLATVKASPTDVLVCHQTFQGATYDNGFYAHDGIDQNEVPANLIISGHIHTPSVIGKVEYVGAPRWRTISDAAVSERHLMLLDLDTLERKYIPTSTHVRKLILLKDTEEAPLEAIALDHHEYRVDIHGSEAFIEARKKFWLGRAKVRCFPTYASKSVVKESEGIDSAFSTFVTNFQPKFGNKEGLVPLVKEYLT